jgi:hypothetical protein
MALDWKILVASGAVVGMGLGGFAVASSSTNAGPVDSIDLVSTGTTPAPSAVSTGAPIRIAPDASVDNTANTPVRRVLADPESAQSAQTAVSAKSVKSPKTPKSVQSPNTPPSTQSPKTPASPQSPQSAQSAG